MSLKELIEAAASIAGSQNKLAALLELSPSNLVEMKKGERPCNWRTRGKLRAVLGEDPARAFMTAMAEDLETSYNEDERKAAASLRVMLTLPDEPAETKNPDSANTDGVVWRRRRDSNPR